MKIAGIINKDAKELAALRVREFPSPWNKDSIDEVDFKGSFSWHATPEGSAFWLDVKNGEDLSGYEWFNFEYVSKCLDDEADPKDWAEINKERNEG